MAQINDYLNGAVTFPQVILPTGKQPLDGRLIVKTKAELNTNNFKTESGDEFWYLGMVVSCLEDSKVYILKLVEDVPTFCEVTPDLPENATKNTTYELSSGANTAKGEIKLQDKDDNSYDTVYVEGDSTNIKVSSTASGVKVEHIVPTKGDALTASATTNEPGYAGTFTAVTGLTKDANGHIVSATLETIKMPGEQDLRNYKTKQTAVADVAASGTASTVVTSVIQNANGEITVTKANLPTESFTGVQVEGVDLKNVSGKVNWGINYDSTKKEIQVLDRNNGNAVLDSIDATSFVKDGLLYAGELVWCTIAEDGTHTEVAEGTKGAIHCLKLTLRVYNRDVEGSYSEEYVHIPLGELCDPYAGTDGEIVVEEEHGKHVIGLADVKSTLNDKLAQELAFSTEETPSTFAAVTGVTVDAKGRVTGVEKTTFTMPELELAEVSKEGSDDYVKVTVTTEDGSVKSVAVDTDALTTKISGIEADLTEVAQVTAAALVDLDARLDSVEAGTITSVTGEDAELNNTAYVNVKATTTKGAVTLASSVKAVETTDKTKYPSTGLATDGYVNEKVATVAATAGTAVQKIESKDATIQVTRAEGSNDVNLELAWAAF